MKKINFNEKKGTELAKLLTEKRETLRAFRFAVAGSKGKNVKEGARARKDIARILTAMHAEAKK